MSKIMAAREEKLKKLQDRHSLELCIHSLLEQGKCEWTIYRVINEEKERNLPIPQAVLDDLNLLLLEEYNLKPGLRRRIKAFITRKKIILQFPFKVSPTGLTVREIEEKQKVWSFHCSSAEISY